MAFNTQASLAGLIATGHSIETAYRVISLELRSAVNTRLAAGEPVDEVLNTLGISTSTGMKAFLRSPGDIDDHRLFIVAAGGGINTIPSASCMAEHLGDKPNPTLDDVQAAIAACRQK